MKDQQSIKLSTGYKIPQVGLGTWLIKKENERIRTVQAALEAGYRHIDTAQYYENMASKVANLLKDTMENVHKLPVDLTVDTKTGHNWGEL